MKKIVVSILLPLALIVFQIHAQDLSQQLSKMGQEAALGYTSPILSSFSSDLNSSLYYSADLHNTLGFDIGVRVGAVSVGDADKTYLFNMPSTFTANGITFEAGRDYVQQYTAPTAVGDKNGVPVNIKQSSPYYAALSALGDTTIFTIPGGFNLSMVPLLAPQVDIGLPFGFEVMGRFIPTIKAGDFGKVNFWALGVRHSIDQYIPVCPVDIAVHFMIQKFNLKDSSDNNLVTANATAFGAEVSKSFAILTIFGGFQIEKGSFTVGPYSFIDESSGTPKPIDIPSFTVEGKNKSRVTLGARVLLGFLNIHAEYSLAKTNVLGAGVGFSFR
jgi:hypothetical protein